MSIKGVCLNTSVVILTKNEAANIERCVGALSGCSDIVVVDSGSTDATGCLAQSLGARVLNNSFESFAQQRNWALEHGDLKHPWALMLDADEIVTPEFCQELEERIRLATDETAGFMICRKTMFLGRWLRHSDAFPVWITRVVRRGQVSFVDAGHGEKVIPAAGQSFGKIEKPILHYSFSKGISEWVDRHNRYSSREALAELDDTFAMSSRWWELFTFDPFRRRQALLSVRRRLPGRPLWRFLYQYFWKRGILEGRAGFVYCLLMSYFEALIVIKRLELTMSGRSPAPDIEPVHRPSLVSDDVNPTH